MAISRRDLAGPRLLLGLTLTLVTWLALTPQPMPMAPGLLLDKWTHLLAFVVLAFLIDASWPLRPFDLGKWGLLMGYGIALELIQMQIPNRVFDFADIFANLLGISLYAFVLARLLRAMGYR
jgi:hypothetical protein